MKRSLIFILFCLLGLQLSAQECLGKSMKEVKRWIGNYRLENDVLVKKEKIKTPMAEKAFFCTFEEQEYTDYSIYYFTNKVCIAESLIFPNFGQDYINYMYENMGFNLNDSIQQLYVKENIYSILIAMGDYVIFTFCFNQENCFKIKDYYEKTIDFYLINKHTNKK